MALVSQHVGGFLVLLLFQVFSITHQTAPAMLPKQRATAEWRLNPDYVDTYLTRAINWPQKVLQ